MIIKPLAVSSNDFYPPFYFTNNISMYTSLSKDSLSRSLSIIEVVAPYVEHADHAKMPTFFKLKADFR